MHAPIAMSPKVVKPIESGVYIGLNEAAYHADPALGSSNLKDLLIDPTIYWWKSWMNPMRPIDDDTPARRRGRAIHNFVLDGPEHFHRKYTRRPDDDEGAKPPEKAALTKAANADAAKAGKHCLHGDDYDRIMVSGTVITANPSLKDAFVGGLPEVSVFWQADGYRFKARMDYLKARTISDLKSLANPMRKPFKRCCREEMRFRNYDIQARHYLTGRDRLSQFVAENMVYGAEHDSDLLKRLAATKGSAFAWVFFQAEGPPLTWGSKVSPNNPFLLEGQEKIEDALEAFTANLNRFGTDAWVLAEDIEELHPNDLPPSYY